MEIFFSRSKFTKFFSLTSKFSVLESASTLYIYKVVFNNYFLKPPFALKKCKPLKNTRTPTLRFVLVDDNFFSWGAGEINNQLKNISLKSRY